MVVKTGYFNLFFLILWGWHCGGNVYNLFQNNLKWRIKLELIMLEELSYKMDPERLRSQYIIVALQKHVFMDYEKNLQCELYVCIIIDRHDS